MDEYLSADEFPFARIQEFMDAALVDADGAIQSLLSDRDYRRVDPGERDDVWASIFFILRSTFTPDELERVNEAARRGLPAGML